ncbi:MAG: T9SS type A sorting domain-containing protein [Bacteroidota bacterium]|nr:T9SS type A sorting domain-containing protein [Bacteroidota bacterium]
MKILFLSLAFIMTIASNGQNIPIDFEQGGHGLNWTWTTFENDTNPALEIVPNPDSSSINPSSTVAKFTALQAGEPWAGVESMHGADIGSFSLDNTNCTVKIMVWKPVISDVGIKFVDATNAAQPEIKVSNTLINQWEELTFDFSSRIGVYPIVKDQIVIFPDFDLGGRSHDNIIYFDNVYGSLNNTNTQDVNHEKMRVHPNPTTDLIYLENLKSFEKLEIYDLIGNLKGTHCHKVIDISSFSNGVYLFRLIFESNTTIIKVIKK